MSLKTSIKNGYSEIREVLDGKDLSEHELFMRAPNGDAVRVKENELSGSQVKNVHGWAYYQDSTYTSGSPLVVNNARVQLTNDGLGANTEDAYLPNGISALWIGNKITPENVGDAYEIRIDFKAKMSQTNAYGEVQLDIGDGSIINIIKRTITFPRGAGVEHSFSMGFPIFCLSTFVTNGGKLYFDTTQGSDNMSVYDIAIFIARINKGE